MLTHQFMPDPTATTWDGQPGCSSCPLPKKHPVHEVEVPEEAAVIDSRKLGENEESE